MILTSTVLFFIAVSLILYIIVPGSLKRYVLLAASLVYILMEGGMSALVAVLCMSVFTYIAGMLAVFEKSRGGSGSESAAIGISALILTLFSWKYLHGERLSLRAAHLSGCPGWRRP